MRQKNNRLFAGNRLLAAMAPFLLLVCIFVIVPRALASVTTWTGAVDSDWQVAGNWSNGVPLLTTTTISTAGPVLLNSGTGYSKTLLISGGQSLTVSNGADLEWFRISIGDTSDGSMTVTGAGTTAIMNDNSSDELVLGANGGSGTLTIADGALLQAGVGSLLLGGTSGHGTLNINNGGILAARFVKNNGSGQVNFDGGIFRALHGASYAVASPFIGFSSGEIALLAGGGTIDTNGFFVEISTPLSGAGGLTKSGDGTLFLTGNNTYTGGTTISGGTLEIGNGGTTGSITGNVTNNGELTFNRSDNITFGGVISGTGFLTKEGAGTLSLSGANTYGWKTAINAGVLSLEGSGTLGGGPISIGNTARLHSANTRTLSQNIIIYDGDVGTASVAAGQTLTLTGTLLLENGSTVVFGSSGNTGTIRLDLTGNGMWATSSFRVAAGTVIAGNDRVGGITSFVSQTIIDAGAVFDFDGQSGYGARIKNLQGAGTLTNFGEMQINTGDFSGVVGGTGSLNKLTSDTLVLSGNNTYSGGTTISAGTLQIGNGGTSGSITGNVSNSGTLTFNRSDNSTFSGAVSGGGAVVKQGNGTLTLSGNSTFSGGTTVTGGTLVVASDGALGSPAFASEGTVDGASSVVRINSGVTLGKSFMALNQATVDNRGTLNGMFGVQSYSSTGAQVINTGTINASFGDAIYVQDGLSVVTNTGGTLKGSGGSGSSGAYLRDGGSVVNDAGGLITSTGDSAITAGDLISGNSSTNTTDILNKGSSTIQGRTYGIELYSGGNITNEAGSSITGQTRSGILFSGGNGTITNYGTITGNATSTRAGVQLSGTAATSATVINYGTINGGISSNNFANTIVLFTGSVVNNKLNLGTNTATVLQLDGTGTQLYSTAVTGNTTFYGQLKKAGSGTWTLDQNLLNAASTEVQAGTLKVNSTLGGSLTVKSGGTLGGNGTIRGAVSVENGAVLAAGNSPGKLTVGSLTLSSLSHTQFELGSPSGTPGVDSDLIDVVSGMSGSTGNLTLGGIFDLITDASFGTGSYRLFDYDGTLTGGNADILFGQAKAGYALTINTSTPGSVYLDVSQDGLQFWDDSQTSPDHTIAGGSGTWNSSSTNWTNAGGNYNGAWDNLTAVFAGGSGGTVTLDETVGVAGLQFGSHDYTLTGNGTINLLSAVTSVLVDGVTATIGVVLDGAGKVLAKTGNGTLVLTANNTYTGGTTIAAGTLQIGNGGTTGSISGNVSNSGTLVFNRSDDITFDGDISGTGDMDKLGANTLTLTGSNTHTGGTTISAGTLQIGNGGTTGSIVGNVTNNGTLVFNRNDDITFDGLISGTGDLGKLGANTLTLTGNNTHTGGTTISAGTLQIGNGGTTGSIVGNVTNNGTLVFNRSDDITFNGLISGTGILGKLGANTLTLTGNNTHTGGTTISAGTLQIGNGGTTGSIVGNVTNNGTLVFNRSDDITFDGLISGTGILGKLGANTLTLTGNNTHTGGTTISAGTLQIGNGGTTGSIVGNVTNNGTLVFNRSDDITFDGLISGTGILGKLGANTLTLTGNNTHTGGTTISAGTLQIGNGGTTGSLTGNVTNNGALVFNRSGNDSFGGTISGSGSLSKLGTNTLVLSAANTYAGGTTISAGTLSTQNVSALGTGPVALNGGSLDPVGKLTISTLTWNGGTVASSLGTSGDWIESTGSLTLGAPGQFVFDGGTGFRNNVAYKILSASNMGTFDPLTQFTGNSLFTLAPVFSIVGNDLFVTFAGTPYFSGAVLQNSAPVGIPTFADFVVTGSASTGSPTENNTIHALIFQPGSSLSVYNTLTVTSGNFTVNGNAQMKGPGTTVVPGTFTKLGNGLLGIFNKLFVNGTAVIRNGGLAVNNMLTASRLLVNQGAWLKGSGIISGDVVNDGTTAPGNSPGTLTVAGNFTQGSGGELQIELGGSAFFDRLLVGGTASLGGRLSALSFGGYVPEYGDRFAFLQAGTISGNFSSVTTWNPSRFRGRFLQNGGTGTLLIAPASYTLVAKNQNQKSVAKALDSFIPAANNDRAVVSTALDFLNAKQYPAAFGQVMPALHGTMANVSIEQAFAQTQMLNQRFSAVRLGAAGFQVLGMNSEPLVNDKDGRSVSDPKDGKAVIRQAVNSHWAAWAMGNGIFAKVTSANQIPAYRSDSGGVLAGADYRWSENYSTGLYVGYQGSCGDYGSAGSMRMNSVLFGGYATFHMGGFYADAVVGGGATNYKVTRSISFSTIDRSARSQQNGGQFTSAFNLGYDWQAGGFTFGPIAGAQYTFVGIAPFTETGAQSLDLAVAGQEANSLRSTLGGRVAYTWKAGRWLTVIPEARMFWQHEFLNNARAIGASLDGGNGAGFDFWTPNPSRDSVFAGVGVTAQIGKTLNASLYYNADFGRQDYVGQMVSAGFNWDF